MDSKDYLAFLYFKYQHILDNQTIGFLEKAKRLVKEDPNLTVVDARKLVSRFGWVKKRLNPNNPKAAKSIMDRPEVQKILNKHKTRKERAIELHRLSPVVFPRDKIQSMFGIRI